MDMGIGAPNSIYDACTVTTRSNFNRFMMAHVVVCPAYILDGFICTKVIFCGSFMYALSVVTLSK